MCQLHSKPYADTTRLHNFHCQSDNHRGMECHCCITLPGMPSCPNITTATHANAHEFMSKFVLPTEAPIVATVSTAAVEPCRQRSKACRCSQQRTALQQLDEHHGTHASHGQAGVHALLQQRRSRAGGKAAPQQQQRRTKITGRIPAVSACRPLVQAAAVYHTVMAARELTKPSCDNTLQTQCGEEEGNIRHMTPPAQPCPPLQHNHHSPVLVLPPRAICTVLAATVMQSHTRHNCNTLPAAEVSNSSSSAASPATR